jgi:FkbM family methyltransferase
MYGVRDATPTAAYNHQVLFKDRLFRVLRPFIHPFTDIKREKVISRLCQKLLPEMVLDAKSIVLDLGANRGDFSHFALRKAGHVIAFEPNPVAFRYLHNRLKSFSRLTLVQAAVSNESGHFDFYLHGDTAADPLGYSIRSSLKKKDSGYVLGDYSVLTLDFDGVLSALPYVSCLKVDIEGAEKDIWPSIVKNKEKISHLLMEIHDSVNQDLRQEVDTFILDHSLERAWTANWK